MARVRMPSARAWIGIAGLVLLAGSLVFVAWQARSAALENARTALEAHMIERMHAPELMFRLDTREPSLAEVWVSPDLPGTMGWRWMLDAQGRVIASTRAADVGQMVGVPRRRDLHSHLREVESAGERAYEVCMAVPRHFLDAGPGRRGPPPPPPHEREAFERGPHASLCTLSPVSEGLAGSEVAKLHFRVSLVIALGLLALAIYLVGDGIRRARARARRTEHDHLQELGQLAGVLAHEIRTPLAALRGYAQLLQERTDASFPERALVERMVEQTTRVSSFVDELVRFARPAPPRFVELDVEQRIHHAIERAYATAQRSGVRLMSECEARTLLADPHRIDALLDNLLSNAIQASPRGEVVTVTSGKVGEQIVIDVRDRGPGVPHEQRDRIFEPFYTTRAAGTGIGLAMALKCAREHGGSLELVDPPGAGVIIRVTLPCQPPPDPAAPRPRARTTARGLARDQLLSKPPEGRPR
jgi:signal transduction histidine kinase